jgi:hypothetical protein
MPAPRIACTALHGFHFSLLVCFFVLASSALRAESPRRLNNDGVAAFQRKEFDQALRSFQKAREQAPESLLLTYNLGAAESVVEKQNEALEEFQKVSSARDAALANRARFAQGVLDYGQAAKKAQEKDLPGALTEAKAAVAANQAVLLANPSDGDARVNYELASLLQQQIEKQLREQQQQQQNKNQDQKNKEDQKDKQQKQEQQKQESAAATPTPAPNPTPQQGQKDRQDRQDQQKQGNPAPTPTPVATPTPRQGTQQQQKPEEPKQKKPAEAQAAQQQKYRKGEDAKEQESLASLLNILQDNDPEALKRMLKRRFGNVIQPEKDW